MHPKQVSPNLQSITFLSSFIQMRNCGRDGVKWTKTSRDMALWVFGDDWHTKQCRWAEIQTKLARRPQSFTIHNSAGSNEE